MASNSSSENAPVRIDIVSGFLGAGKTTFINALLEEGMASEDVAIVENELGDTPIDDALLNSNGIRMTTLASGCICCSLSGSFATSIVDIVQTYHPRRIIVEPTGIAGASEIVRICEREIWQIDLEIGAVVTMVNAKNVAKLIDLEIGAFMSQLAEADFVLLNRTEEIPASEVEAAKEALIGVIPNSALVHIPAKEGTWALEALMLAEEARSTAKSHATHRECNCDEDHHDDAHHHHGEDGHHHDGGLMSVSLEPTRALTFAEIDRITDTLKQGDAGCVLRAKGFVEGADTGASILYEYVYGQGTANPCPRYEGAGKAVVIGRDIQPLALAELFGNARIIPSSSHNHH